MNKHTAIRKSLDRLGIKSAIVENTMCDRVPTVLLRWNGREEHVSALHFALGKFDFQNADDGQYITWLVKTYADVNLPAPRLA